MAVTKLRGRQTAAGNKYDPQSDSLATDKEVEERVKLHSELFHHNRNDVIKLYFTDGNLSEIKTFNNDNEDLLLGLTAFSFTNGNLSEIEKKVYRADGSSLYMHVKKTFEFDTQGNLLKISNEKII